MLSQCPPFLVTFICVSLRARGARFLVCIALSRKRPPCAVGPANEAGKGQAQPRHNARPISAPQESRESPHPAPKVAPYPPKSCAIPAQKLRHTRPKVALRERGCGLDAGRLRFRVLRPRQAYGRAVGVFPVERRAVPPSPVGSRVLRTHPRVASLTLRSAGGSHEEWEPCVWLPFGQM